MKAIDPRVGRSKILFTINEAAEVIGMAPRTIRNQMCLGPKTRMKRMEEGKQPFPIPHKRYGKRVLFHINDLRAFADSLPYDDAEDSTRL